MAAIYARFFAIHWAYEAIIEAYNDHECRRKTNGYETWIRGSLVDGNGSTGLTLE